MGSWAQIIAACFLQAIPIAVLLAIVSQFPEGATKPVKKKYRRIRARNKNIEVRPTTSGFDWISEELNEDFR